MRAKPTGLEMRLTSAMETAGRGEALPATEASYLLGHLQLAMRTIQEVRRTVGDGPKKRLPKVVEKAPALSYQKLLGALRRGHWVLEPSHAPPGFYARVVAQAASYRLTEEKAELLGRWLALEPYWSKQNVTVDQVMRKMAEWLPKAENLQEPGSATVWEEVEDGQPDGE